MQEKMLETVKESMIEFLKCDDLRMELTYKNDDEITLKISKNKESKSSDEQFTTEAKLDKVMYEIGFRQYLKGYVYTKCAIFMILEDRNNFKRLYSRLAKKYNEPIQKIERNIRSTKEITWENDSKEKIEEVLGYSISKDTKIPANMEWIYSIANYISNIE